MLQVRQRRLSTALKRALGGFEVGEDDPVEAMRNAIECALCEDEDVLTALIFERLRYLPEALAWNLVVDSSSVVRGLRPTFGGDLREDAWPSLAHATADSVVEPDVVWWSGNIALGIEVKWKGTQTVEQLDKEFAALAKHSPGFTTAMLAVGGITEDRRQQLATQCTASPLLALEWLDFYKTVRTSRGDSGLPIHVRRVLDDILEILAMRQPLWAREPRDFSSLPQWGLEIPASLAQPTPFASKRTAPLGASGTFRSFASLPTFRFTTAETLLPSWRAA